MLCLRIPKFPGINLGEETCQFRLSPDVKGPVF